MVPVVTDLLCHWGTINRFTKPRTEGPTCRDTGRTLLCDGEVVGDQIRVDVVPDIGVRVLMCTEEGEDVIEDIIPRVVQGTVEYNTFDEEM